MFSAAPVNGHSNAVTLSMTTAGGRRIAGGRRFVSVLATEKFYLRCTADECKLRRIADKLAAAHSCSTIKMKSRSPSASKPNVAPHVKPEQIYRYRHHFWERHKLSQYCIEIMAVTDLVIFLIKSISINVEIPIR